MDVKTQGQSHENRSNRSTGKNTRRHRGVVVQRCMFGLRLRAGRCTPRPSLRKTRLDRAALVEAISCGLPGTQMPAWLDGAYTQRPCYGFPAGPAPSGTDLSPVLSANEIQALVDYLLAKIVGR
jgi:hypothetical protein